MILPLWLDLGGLRVVHACWDARLIAKIAVSQGGSHLLSEDLLVLASRRSQWQYEALETLLKGKEIRLPDGASFRDKDGTSRHNIRVRWWDQGATNFKERFSVPRAPGRTSPMTRLRATIWSTTHMRRRRSSWAITGWRAIRRHWQGTSPAWITAWLNPAAD